jgi:LmbE family N-acetylglucosaminyl deacetylase
MIKLLHDSLRLRTILCIAAHCDDVEIGCAGTLLELRARFPAAHFYWFVLSGDETRASETRTASERLFAENARCTVDVQRFRASYFPSHAGEIKDAFESLKSRVVPELIFTHYLYDRHQDHRLLAELTWNTFRDHTILEYEIPKFEGDLAQPNVYVPLSNATVDRKINMLEECFPSQRSRSWFSADVFRGLMRIRGVECNSESGFAEAFHGRKLTL